MVKVTGNQAANPACIEIYL